MNENQVNIGMLGPAETVNVMEEILDKLADSTGRARCGYIFIMSELIDNMKRFIVPAPQEPEVTVEEIPEEEAQNNE